MIDFNEKTVKEQADQLYALRGELEAVADKVCEKGFDNILFTSAGGSLAALEPFAYMMKSMSKIPVFTEIPAELMATDNALITDKTVAILTSKSGDTKETVAAAKWLAEKNVTTISFCGEPDSPLKAATTYSVCYGNAEPHDLIAIFVLGRILYNKCEFADYPKFADELKNLGDVLVSVAKASDAKGMEYAKRFDEKDKEYQIWTGSGMTWGHTYSMAMCVLEECQWLRTKSVNSAEFFHGTIELVEKGVLVCVGMGEGPTRPLDERVIRFVEKHTDQLVVFDTKEYEFPGISEQFRWMLSPVILWAIYERAYKNLAEIRKHTLDIRRYYRRLEY
ncbi:MAG: SIS domain-containing protein [Lachnospiraceae bacterium]|jgi:fructoselysine-6-phosphate deglycase|nr:SIS domain-containing protein [Lachnospiraceae bacterium]